MFEPLGSQSHYEQRAFDVERERAEAVRLLDAREANSIALGEHFLRAKERLSKKEYGDYVKSLGLHPLTAEGFMRSASGAKVAPRKRDPEAPRRRMLAEVQALLAEAPDLETARRVIAEELNELTA